MARASRNVLTHNYSGKVGKQYVLRIRGQKSIIAMLPKPRSADAVLTPEQLETREQFRLAAIYARKSKGNQVLMEGYAAARRGNQTAFNVAFMDARKSPELSKLRTDAYTGEAGQPIVVQAVDNFRISKVTFTLLAADGSLLEQGPAVEDETGRDWIYTTQVANPLLTGTTIQVTAEDIPKNQSKLEVVL